MLKKLLLFCALPAIILSSAGSAQTMDGITGVAGETIFVIKIRSSAGHYPESNNEEVTGQCDAAFLKIYIQLMLQSLSCETTVVQADPCLLSADMMDALGFSSQPGFHTSKQIGLINKLIMEMSSSDEAAKRGMTSPLDCREQTREKVIDENEIK